MLIHFVYSYVYTPPKGHSGTFRGPGDLKSFNWVAGWAFDIFIGPQNPPCRTCPNKNAFGSKAHTCWMGTLITSCSRMNSSSDYCYTLCNPRLKVVSSSGETLRTLRGLWGYDSFGDMAHSEQPCSKWYLHSDHLWSSQGSHLDPFPSQLLLKSSGFSSSLISPPRLTCFQKRNLRNSFVLR